jgi:hypothetical protein
LSVETGGELDCPTPESRSTLQAIVPPKQWLLAYFIFMAIVSSSSYAIHWSFHVIVFIIEFSSSCGVRFLSAIKALISVKDITPAWLVHWPGLLPPEKKQPG